MATHKAALEGSITYISCRGSFVDGKWFNFDMILSAFNIAIIMDNSLASGRKKVKQ